jgi:hypothetical protein
VIELHFFAVRVDFVILHLLRDIIEDPSRFRQRFWTLRLSNFLPEVSPLLLLHELIKCGALNITVLLGRQILEKSRDRLGFGIRFVRVAHDGQKLREFDHARAVLVHVLDQLSHLINVFCETQPYQRLFQLFAPDAARQVPVQTVEVLAKVLNLLVCEI